MASVTASTGSHANEVSPATKRDVSESHEEEKTVSCKNEKGLDIPMQKPSSNPSAPVEECTQPLASHLTRHWKALEKLQPRRNLDSGIPSRVPGDLSKIPKDEPDNLLLRQTPDSGVESFMEGPTSQSDKKELVLSTGPEKALEKLQPRRNPDTGGYNSSQSDQIRACSSVSEKFSIIPKEEPKTSYLQPSQCLAAANPALISKEGKSISLEKETFSDNLVSIASFTDVGVTVLQSEQQNATHSTKFEKVEKLQPRRNPDPGVQGTQSDAEKGLDDGYNWRKYGQKLVKGNEFVRSYYKCTYPGCQAKKQVERSYDWCKTEVNYLGQHEHPKPQNSPQVIPEMPLTITSKAGAELIINHGGANQNLGPIQTSRKSTIARSGDGVAVVVSGSNGDNNEKDVYPDSKRQKREITTVSDSVVNRPNNDSRHVVQTFSEVDLVNDGYRWRKYGQKLVKGNPNPRSYYRCSNAGCPVKKHVERASHDPKVVITTYEGEHVHDMPPSRTVTQTQIQDANMMTTNGESTSKPEENNPNPVGLEMVVHVNAN